MNNKVQNFNLKYFHPPEFNPVPPPRLAQRRDQGFYTNVLLESFDTFLTHMWFAFRFIDCNKLLGFELFIYLSRRKPNGNDFISIYFAFLDIYSSL